MDTIRRWLPLALVECLNHFCSRRSSTIKKREKRIVSTEKWQQFKLQLRSDASDQNKTFNLQPDDILPILNEIQSLLKQQQPQTSNRKPSSGANLNKPQPQSKPKAKEMGNLSPRGRISTMDDRGLDGGIDGGLDHFEVDDAEPSQDKPSE